MGPDFVFRLGMTLHDIREQGISFVRETDMKTGWITRTADYHIIKGHTIYPSLGFKNDILERISFSFTDEQVELPALRDMHDRFLVQELGQPTSRNTQTTSYTFPLGGISSDIDPRGGTAQIHMVIR